MNASSRPNFSNREAAIAADVLYRARGLQTALDLLASGRITAAASAIADAQRLLDWPCTRAIETGRWPELCPAVRKAVSQ